MNIKHGKILPLLEVSDEFLGGKTVGLNVYIDKWSMGANQANFVVQVFFFCFFFNLSEL